MQRNEDAARANNAGKEVMVVGLSLPVARILGRLGVLDEIKTTARFATRSEALAAAAEHTEVEPQ